MRFENTQANKAIYFSYKSVVQIHRTVGNAPLKMQNLISFKSIGNVIFCPQP